MSINILLFAQIADLFGTHTMKMENVADTDSVVLELEKIKVQLGDYKYVIAVNEDIIHGNSPVEDNDVIALLPPFAGG